MDRSEFTANEFLQQTRAPASWEKAAPVRARKPVGFLHRVLSLCFTWAF